MKEEDTMEFIDVITERYSVRGYLDKEVEKEKEEEKAPSRDKKVTPKKLSRKADDAE